MTTATELKTRILTRAAEDGEFRTRLLTDPRVAISAETGVTIPTGFNVVVHAVAESAFETVGVRAGP